jgi:hypothetical protein
MRAWVLLLGLNFTEAPRPDTLAAIHSVVLEVSALAEAESYESARALLESQRVKMEAAPAQTWLERWRGEATATLEERALLTHARGVLEMQAGDIAAAAEALARARAEAGPGALRLNATYDLGVLHLEEGELYRAQIPELSNGAVAPPPAAPVDGEEPADPLELAREQYLKARDWFIERLSLDWQDADTQANVELVQRRLRELDEIEEDREQQEEEQEQEQEDGDGEQEEGEEGEESSEDEEQPGEDSQDNAEGEREPEEPEDGEEQEDEQEAEEEADAEPEEVHLTQEEMQRLLESLRQIEEDGEDVQEALRRIGRQGVDRDW